MQTGFRVWMGAVAWLGALALSGCHGVLWPRAVGDLQQQREAALAAADWTKQVNLEIEMLDYGYRPREVRLKVGQPYRLTLVNHGSVNHYFTAPEFFSSVATRKAEVPRQAEIKGQTFTAFEVYGRGGTIDYYFVPLVKGSYRAHCHIKDHLALAIEGVLIVE